MTDVRISSSESEESIPTRPQIKLRAWLVEDKKMCSWPEMIANPHLLRSVMGNEYYATCPPKYLWIPMLYSEVNDKNGVEVYDGDILKHVYSTFSDAELKVSAGDVTEYWEVYWTKGGFRVTRINDPWGDCCAADDWLVKGERDFHFNHAEEMEVAGNIHQNPELLVKTNG